MIDVFERYAPKWRRIVREYAELVWNGKDTDETRLDYDMQALSFAKSYRHALELHYAKKGMNVYRGTLDGKVREWLTNQHALRDTISTAIAERQAQLFDKEIARLRKDDSYDAQKMINKLYEAKDGENVYKVFSFADHYKDRAEQIGDDNAYELGTQINETVIKQYSDRYIWDTQRDKKVRYTHRKFQNKCFLFDDPPTEISKSGKVHKGNPGTAWGCRCFATIPTKPIKPLRGYVVHER